MMFGMKRAKTVKMWSELGDARPRLGDFEDYMNRPMRRGPYGFLRFGDVYEYLTRGEYWWMYLRAFRRGCSRRVARLKAAERRPRYYAAENERRRALAAERRKIRARTTVNACPTREAVLEAWHLRKDSHEAAVRFGSMLEDLECCLDNSLRRDEDGVIIGRNPGIKGWLRDSLPEIYEKYTTAMRYKAAAKKLKQVVELADPTPADVVLPHGSAERVEDANMLAAWREKYANEITERTKKRWWRRLVEKSRPRKARKRAA